MTADLHIEGMGALGAIIARHLDATGIPFTWSDTDAPYTAWPASTGLIYPEGSPRSMDDLAAWYRWAPLFASDELIPASYVFVQKSIPHGGRYIVHELGHGLRQAEPPAMVLDVPLLVRRTRAAHTDHRLPATPPARVVIRAHGGQRIARYKWGWSAPVRLDTTAITTPHTPVIVGRVVRRLTYAHPIPSRPGWWRAGSDLFTQTTPRHLDAGKHFTRWQRDWAHLHPNIPILDAEPPTEGWRPEPAPTDPQNVQIAADGALHMPPMWHDGVRHAPTVVTDLLTRVGLPTEVAA